jgi:ribosomal protein L27
MPELADAPAPGFERLREFKGEEAYRHRVGGTCNGFQSDVNDLGVAASGKQLISLTKITGRLPASTLTGGGTCNGFQSDVNDLGVAASDKQLISLTKITGGDCRLLP